jgi:predicted Zn-dependent peptidase
MALDFSDLERQVQERGRIHRLDNGLVVVSEHVPNSGLVQGKITINTGSAYEAPEDHGIMHFLEHMTFGESNLYQNRDKRKFDAALLGLSINAITGFDQIGYPIEGAGCPILQENFLQALEIYTDLVFNPTFTQSSLDRERPIVQKEREEVVAQRNGMIGERIFQILFKNNPYPIYHVEGSRDSIDRITLDKLAQYHNRFFVANNTHVEIIGDLNGQSGIESIAIENLSKIKRSDNISHIETVCEDEIEQTKVETLSNLRDLPYEGNVRVNIYFKIPPYHHVDANSLNILSYVLGGSYHSLLTSDLRESKGLVYSISSDIIGNQKSSYLQIGFSVKKKDIEVSMGAVEHNINKVKRGEFDDMYLDMYRASKLPQMINLFQSHGWITKHLFETMQLEKSEIDSTYLSRQSRINDVTKQDVVDAAKRYLGDNRIIIAY